MKYHDKIARMNAEDRINAINAIDDFMYVMYRFNFIDDFFDYLIMRGKLKVPKKKWKVYESEL